MRDKCWLRRTLSTRDTQKLEQAASKLTTIRQPNDVKSIKLNELFILQRFSRSEKCLHRELLVCTILVVPFRVIINKLLD